MKKTIIALMALAGVVTAATKSTIDTKDTALVSYFNYAEGNSQTAGTASGWGELMSWNKEGQYGTTGSQNCMYTNGGINFSMKDSGGFTFSFDINNITQTGTILTLMTNNGSAGIAGSPIWRGMRVEIAQDNDTGAYALSALIGDKTLNVDLGTEISWTTLTLVGTANTAGVTENNQLTMDFGIYVNGELSASYTNYGAWNFVAEPLNRVQFGYWGDASKNTQLDIDNVLIYSRPLSADEVKALTIPEPTTATLSLLALAGLAARRRRK